MQNETLQETLARLRTTLAIERTFAAWIRTGLASIGGGLAIIKLIPFRNYSNQLIANIIGILLAIWGISVIIIGFLNYKHLAKEISGTHNQDRLIRRFTVITLSIILIGLLILFISTRHAFFTK